MVASPADYQWSGHRGLRAEDTSVLDLHDFYLDLGPDGGSRYRAYQALLAEEAHRPAHSLARVYFAGTPRFVGRMESRFGFAGARRPRRVDIGSGVVCSMPLRGNGSGQV